MIEVFWAMPTEQCRLCATEGFVSKQTALCEDCEQRFRRWWKFSTDWEPECPDDDAPDEEWDRWNDANTAAYERFQNDPIPPLELTHWIAFVLENHKRYKWLGTK